MLTPNPEMIELHAVAHGQVQGVGFRATVQAHARSMRLNGKVRNCTDGTVELIAQGSPSNWKASCLSYSKTLVTQRSNISMLNTKDLVICSTAFMLFFSIL